MASLATSWEVEITKNLKRLKTAVVVLLCNCNQYLQVSKWFICLLLNLMLLSFTTKFVVESDCSIFLGLFVVEKEFSIAQMVSAIILSEETKVTL
jgi:hypothetical protein